MNNVKPHLVIVTGLSGAGKSTVIKAFEDIDYFCIDNLPVPLLPHFLQLCSEKMEGISRIALGIDIRERSFLQECEKIFPQLESSGYSPEIVFVEASVDVLQKRYSQTRRIHPLEHLVANPKRQDKIGEAIKKEKELLALLRKRATKIIDTSNFNVHDLKSLIIHTYRRVPEKDLMSIQVMSFGYKYGLPLEADVVMDVRFLPNPYFDDKLRDLTGCDAEVSEWIFQQEETKEFLKLFEGLFDFLTPRYLKEGKRYLNIAFGCTGGKHRSVVIAEHFAKWFKNKGYLCDILHRDIKVE